VRRRIHVIWGGGYMSYEAGLNEERLSNVKCEWGGGYISYEEEEDTCHMRIHVIQCGLAWCLSEEEDICHMRRRRIHVIHCGLAWPRSTTDSHPYLLAPLFPLLGNQRIHQRIYFGKHVQNIGGGGRCLARAVIELPDSDVCKDNDHLIIAILERREGDTRTELMLQGKRDLIQGKRDLVQGKRDVVQGKRDLVQGKRDLVQSKRDLVQGKRDLVQGKRDLERREGDTRTEGAPALYNLQIALAVGEYFFDLYGIHWGGVAGWYRDRYS
jgi:hypothetical protein